MEQNQSYEYSQEELEVVNNFVGFVTKIVPEVFEDQEYMDASESYVSDTTFYNPFIAFDEIRVHRLQDRDLRETPDDDYGINVLCKGTEIVDLTVTLNPDHSFNRIYITVGSMGDELKLDNREKIGLLDNVFKSAQTLIESSQFQKK